MQNRQITFIGAGNMTRSLVGGLVADGVPADRIRAADPNEEQRAQMVASCNIAVYADNAEATEDADVIVLAVKPQVLREVATSLRNNLDADKPPLCISIAAGIREADLLRWLGGQAPIVRAMPNTPALLRSGVTALYANRYTSTAQREMAESILRAVGAVIWLDDEALIDAVTAVSGSGPAYFFLFMERIAAVAAELGLSAGHARLLTVETALGAARMALETSEDLATLRKQVTSPGGTTAAALEILDSPQLDELIRAAITSARDRGEELAQQFGQD